MPLFMLTLIYNPFRYFSFFLNMLIYVHLLLSTFKVYKENIEDAGSMNKTEHGRIILNIHPILLCAEN